MSIRHGPRRSHINKQVSYIGNSAFDECTDLTEIITSDVQIGIKTSNNVVGIGDNAFKNCKKLRNAIVPDRATSIANGAFFGCISLVSIVIPKSVTSIGTIAFLGCINLTSITIPSSVTAIGEGTFLNCNALTEIKGVKGSFAETWAKENGYTFIVQ